MQETTKRRNRQRREAEQHEAEAKHVSAEVLAEASCCLVTIDEALTQAEAETDEAIYKAGHPDRWNKGGSLRGEAWARAHDRFAQAYENLTGVTHSCGCGHCGNQVVGYNGDGRGGGPRDI